MQLSKKGEFYVTRDGSVVRMHIHTGKCLAKFSSIDWLYPFTGTVSSPDYSLNESIEGRWNSCGKFLDRTKPNYHPKDIIKKLDKLEFKYRERRRQIISYHRTTIENFGLNVSYPLDLLNFLTIFEFETQEDLNLFNLSVKELMPVEWNNKINLELRVKE